MFGESDSESPRVPSPWDSLTPPSSSPPKGNDNNGSRPQAIPKLVPEADEGNVEYKLQLLSPSPARFARLVTQLKWRLLEGGGQAYYELGVADSGTLVGLPRHQLEESLDTLEMMAGEIGASVIVVKEIEVSPELSSLAESQLERWDGRKSTRRKDLMRTMKCDASPATPTTELEIELSSADVTDAEEGSRYSPVTFLASPERETDSTLGSLPIPSLPLFTMDIGEDCVDGAENKDLDGNIATDCVTEVSISLEISSVYKPRLMKKRATHVSSPPQTHPAHYKKKFKNGHPPSKFADTIPHSTPQISEALLQHRVVKTQPCGDRENNRRVSKLDNLLTHVPTCRTNESSINAASHDANPPCLTDEPDPFGPEPGHTAVVDSPTGNGQSASEEPRIIVEALVVRKLSMDEAFLDFEGFSLQ